LRIQQGLGSTNSCESKFMTKQTTAAEIGNK
jgi:hypothetical protein